MTGFSLAIRIVITTDSFLSLANLGAIPLPLASSYAISFRNRIYFAISI